MNYPEVLKSARLRSGLSQGDLATKAGLTGRDARKTISNIEGGIIKRPRAEKWIPLCAALGIDPATGSDLPVVQESLTTVGWSIRERGSGHWLPLTLQAMRALPDGFYEVQDPTGEVGEVKAVSKLGCLVWENVTRHEPNLSTSVPAYKERKSK